MDKKRRASLRSPTVRELARKLAALGHLTVTQGHPLNTRRRENVRRVLAEAGESLGWAEVVAAKNDPIPEVTEDVKKMLRSGVKALERGLADELTEMKAEEGRLLELIETVQCIAEDPDAEFPQEISYSRTAKNGEAHFATTTDTLNLSDAEDALKAAQRIEKSLPRWRQLREEAIAELRERQTTLGLVGRNLSDLVEGWRGLMSDVLMNMT